MGETLMIGPKKGGLVLNIDNQVQKGAYNLDVEIYNESTSIHIAVYRRHDGYLKMHIAAPKEFNIKRLPQKEKDQSED